MKQQFMQRKTRRGWELHSGFKRVAGSGLLMAAMTLGTGLAGAERPSTTAGEANTTSADGAAPAPMPVKRFKIADGSLDQALEAFKAQSGVVVTVDIPATKLATFHSKGADGVLASDAALRLLLADTGLSFAFDGVDKVTVGLKHTESVDVTSTLSDSVAMGKFTESLIDTPQTVEVVPQFVLRDQQNRSLTDAIRNVPGISIAAGESGAQGDNLTIRGFTARNDIFLDGIRDFGSYYRDSFDFEQVEVLEGPAGVQFGRGSTGGVINQENKAPAADKFVNANAVLGTDTTRRVTVDVNEPLSEAAGGIAFRLNALATEGGVAGRPFAENRRYGVAPAVTFGMNSASRVTLGYFHFSENDTPDYGLPWFYNGVAPGVNRHSYFGFPENNYLRTSDDIVTLKANKALGLNVDVHTIARWANYPRSVQITEPQICSNAAVSVPVGGWVAALPTSSVTGAACPYTPLNVNPASVAVNRNQLQIKSVEGELWDQTEVTAHFRALGIRHNFAGGVEGGREVSNPVRTSYTVNKLNTVPSTTLLSPNAGDVFGGTGYISAITHVTSKSAGVYFVDTVHLGKLFEASGGVRWDHFDTLFSLYSPATSLVGAAPTNAPGVVTLASQVVEKPSYRAAFVYKPTAHGSVYFDYGTSFNPSAESLSLSMLTSVLPPEENETYEVGAKYSLMRDRLKVEGAWFNTTKLNARETDPTNSNNIQLSGNQRVRGFQTSAVGRLAGGTDLVLGYAYLSSAVTASALFPTSVGYQLANVPKQTFNGFLTHNLPWHISAGFGGNYVGSRTASSSVPYVPTSFGPATTFAAGAAPCNVSATAAIKCYQVQTVGMKQVPSYWVFNAMVRRPITDRLELQANVYNMLDRCYIDQPHPSHLIPGAGLSALIGANFRF